MGSLLERLEQWEAAARARVEGLRAEMAALAEGLAAEEELLGRFEITTQTVLEVLAGDEVTDNGAVVADAGPAPGAGVGAGPASGMGVQLQVPAFSRGGDGQGLPVLPVAYRDVVEVLADAARPLRAMQVMCPGLRGAGLPERHATVWAVACCRSYSIGVSMPRALCRR